MKKIILVLSLLLVLGGVAWAEDQNQQYGTGYGMMGGGYGMVPGMMGGGYGMGPGMMGSGYGMGPGMMGGGYGGYGVGTVITPQMQKFLDETKELRKELHLKQFEYMEALRNPKTAPDELIKIQKEIRAINIKIYEKMPLD